MCVWMAVATLGFPLDPTTIHIPTRTTGISQGVRRVKSTQKDTRSELRTRNQTRPLHYISILIFPFAIAYSIVGNMSIVLRLDGFISGTFSAVNRRPLVVRPSTQAKIFLRSVFCWTLRLAGIFMLISTMKSPLTRVLEFGMP